MTFGFCFALLPLLSLDLESVFGREQVCFLRIPADELSCPEEYLAKNFPDEDVETGEDEKETIVSDVWSIVCLKQGPSYKSWLLCGGPTQYVFLFVFFATATNSGCSDRVNSSLVKSGLKLESGFC